MNFEVLTEIRAVEIIATGRGVRILDRLNRDFGRGSWRKLKGVATVRLASGRVVEAELHWYEAHGIGRCEHKIKLRS